MSGANNAFSPLGSTVAVTAPSASSSSSTALPGSLGQSIKIINTCTNPVGVGTSTTSGGAAGTATSPIVVAAGLSEVFSLPLGTVDVACYGIGGTGVVYLTRGDGQ